MGWGTWKQGNWGVVEGGKLKVETREKWEWQNMGIGGNGNGGNGNGGNRNGGKWKQDK